MTTEIFKQALGRFATGVCVVNFLDGDVAEGVTISAFSSLSLAPQKVLFCLGNQGKSQQRFQQVDRFSISILTAEQTVLAYQFAGESRDGIESQLMTVDGLPAVRDALAVLVCAKGASYPEGDHDIVIGDVQQIVLGDSQKAPLLYYRSTMSEGPIYET
ncbi:flavin reductase family protein [Ostreibacterium oceani]|uniref:Flavin reductase like domain-containing protein n=1 Tax=Ostreibacterium oceani TaxID=2654998 RepID=A0A6N7EV40_9GAMM|nr:flavin reductase family protein [Ostreibacterium oceani]MPV85475.1 hypothetical protein [Ostreibacterium oceani]